MSRSGSGARDQVARLLALVPLLHSRDGLRVQEAAELLGTTPAQVLGDLRVLWMCGLPGGMTDDLIDVDMETLEDDGAAGVIHVSNADYLARPVRLSATEATALVVALRTVRDSSPEETRAIVDSVIAKLEVAAAHEVPSSRIAVEPSAPHVRSVRVPLEQALRDHRHVHLTYWVPSRDEISERTVDPIRLAEVNGVDYLEAWCHRAEDRRVFRLDRVQGVELAGPTKRSAPSDPDAEALSVDLFQFGDDALTVTLALAPEARWVPEYYAVEDVRHRAGGRLEVDLKVQDLAWLRQLVLRLAPHATVLSPAAAVEHVRSAVDAALTFHG